MRRSLASFMLLAALSAGCGDDGNGNGNGTSTEFDLPGSGFDLTGVDGFGNLDLPDSWLHLFGRKQDGDFQLECRSLHRCGVAGVVPSLELLSGESGNFAVVTTGDFRCEGDDFSEDPPPPCTGQQVAVEVSGTETAPILVDTEDDQAWTGAELLFRYVLLSAREDPAGSVDSVVIKAGPDGGPMATVLRLSSGSLGGSLPLRAGGCGTQALPDTGAAGIATTYHSCSEWQDGAADITEFIGQEVKFQFIAGEAGAAIALALDDVRVELSR
jgi:hypothetical protein